MAIFCKGQNQSILLHGNHCVSTSGTPLAPNLVDTVFTALNTWVHSTCLLTTTFPLPKLQVDYPLPSKPLGALPRLCLTFQGFSVISFRMAVSSLLHPVPLPGSGWRLLRCSSKHLLWWQASLRWTAESPMPAVPPPTRRGHDWVHHKFPTTSGSWVTLCLRNFDQE